MEDYNYYQVQGWMVNNLKLRGNELICYAIIYSFSQDEESKFMGGVKYLCTWMNASEPTVISILDKLSQRGLIEPIKVITKTCKRVYYQVTKDSLVRGNLKILSKVTKESLETLYYNNNNKETNKKGDNNKSLSPQKSRFKKPTIEEIAAYIEEKKFTFDAERFYDYYESKGWVVGKSPMKDWKAACRTWAAQRKSLIKEEDQEERSGLPAGLTEETWALRQEWMRKYVPRIAERISPEAFLSMQGKSHYNPEIFKDIIIEIENSDYNGDIAQEFIRLCDTDEYAKRLWSGE